MTTEGSIVATVTEIILGRHGPFAVAAPKDPGQKERMGFITFALKSGVWDESRHPEAGHDVVLSDLTSKQGKWRANKARFFRPADMEKGI